MSEEDGDERTHNEWTYETVSLGCVSWSMAHDVHPGLESLHVMCYS